MMTSWIWPSEFRESPYEQRSSGARGQGSSWMSSSTSQGGWKEEQDVGREARVASLQRCDTQTWSCRESWVLRTSGTHLSSKVNFQTAKKR